MPRLLSNKSIIVGIALVCAGYYAYTKFMPNGGGWAGGGAPPVSVAEVVGRNVRQWHEFSGRLVAINQVDVRPRVSGVIDRVHFVDGAQVKQGDILFTIDPRPFAAEVVRTEGLLGSAEAQLSLTRAELTRAERLIKDKAIPQHEFDQHRNDFNVAEANVKSAKAALDVAKLTLEYASVRAPISGRASRAEITAGNLVQAENAPLLTTVVPSDEIYADFEIDEGTFLEYAHSGSTSVSEVNKIPVKMALSGEMEAKHGGHVSSFDNRLNTSSGTIRVRAVFDNSDGMLVPGLLAKIQIGSATEAASLLITDRAIGTDQNKKFVYMLGADNKVSYREVTLGQSTEDGLRVVTDGLKVGDKIVVSGIQRIMMPGQPVTPEMVPMDAKEPAVTEAPKTQDAS
jgi:multidrug efflux system membrane fusion protein